MFITKKALSRRTFLRGAGTTLALPFLDAMVPALSAQPLKANAAAGFHLHRQRRDSESVESRNDRRRNLNCTPTLQPLETVKNQLNVVSGLAHLQADTFGDGTGDHPRASAAWLTGVHAYDRTQPGVEVRLATTADQIAARVIGKGDADSFARDDRGLPHAGRVRLRRLFLRQHDFLAQRNNSESRRNASSHGVRAAVRRWRKRGAALGADQEHRKHPRFRSPGGECLRKDSGQGDRTKLNEYMESVREIEQRIQSAKSQGDTHSIELPDRPIDIPESFDEYTKLMFDLAGARVSGRRHARLHDDFCRGNSARAPIAQIGVPDQHHAGVASPERSRS